MPASIGSNHHAAKLTEAKVRAARKSFARGGVILVEGKRVPVSTTNLARKYGVTPQSMHAVLTGRNWKHVS